MEATVLDKITNTIYKLYWVVTRKLTGYKYCREEVHKKMVKNKANIIEY